MVVFWCSDQISTTCSCRVTFLGSSSLDLSPSFALPVVFHLNNDMIFFGFNRISHFVFGRNKCMCSSSHVLCYGRMQSNANHNFDLYGGTSFVLVTLTQRSKFVLVVGKYWGFCQGISMFFSICFGKKNAKASEFLGIFKKYFSKNEKYIFLFSEEEKCLA